jgi:chromate reductase
MRILAVSGSLRAQSTNTALLRAAALLAPPTITITLFEGMDQIPAFNSDLDVDSGPGPVSGFREGIRNSDAVVFSTPEYAHGIPGSLKNALDWIVGSGELCGKPVTLINASNRGGYAQASLREVLKTMNARLLLEAETSVPLLGQAMDADQIAATPEFAALIQSSLQKIASCL